MTEDHSAIETNSRSRAALSEPLSKQATISVVVCAYTEARWGDLCDTIASLLAQTHRPDETILVIDNNASLFARASAHFTTITVVVNRFGRGLSGARNTGIEESSGALVAFIDDDATLEPDVIACLVEASQMPGVLGASAYIIPEWVGDRPSWFPDEYLWTVGCTHEPSSGQVRDVRNVTGAACIFRRRVFSECGTFCEILGRGKSSVPVSCEETEICLRARLRFEGETFVRDERALVYHKVPAMRLSWRYFLLRCYAEGLSKGRLRNMLPSGAHLGTERSYIMHGLLPALSRALWTGFFRLEASSLARSSAIVLGLGAAAVGYAGSRFSSAFGTTAHSATGT